MALTSLVMNCLFITIHKFGVGIFFIYSFFMFLMSLLLPKAPYVIKNTVKLLYY